MAWRLAKSLEMLRSQVNAKYPNRSKMSDGTIGDPAHSARTSDHNPNSAGVVTAMDITHDPAHGVNAGLLAETLLASRDPRIKYIISNRRIAASSVVGSTPAWQWRSYTGSNPHDKHVHVSVSASASKYDSVAPWKIDGQMPAPKPIESVAVGKNTYDEALRRLLADEGGYSDHPTDPGGPTNFGITLTDYRKYINPQGMASDVRNMTVDQAKRIYKSKYWNAMNCDALPAGLDYAVFDYGVNSGIGRAPKVLQRIVGVPADGAIGPATLESISKRDVNGLINALCDERMVYLRSLKIWPTFGKGWTRRVTGVRAAALVMADKAKLAPAVKTVVMTGPPAAAAGGWWFWDWITAHPVPSIVAAVAIVVLVVAGIGAYRRRTKSPPSAPPTSDAPRASALDEVSL